MKESEIQINGEIPIDVDVSVKKSCIRERLCLEPCYM